jgi:hypothetical protein
LEAPASCYLKGYWQSPKYFASVESYIRQDIVVKEPLAGVNFEIAERIVDSQSVSLHVRRGDYATNPVTQNYHGTCGPEYYESAQRALLEQLGSIELFVFSDDPDWVEHNLRFLAPATMMQHNGPSRDYEDLRLLSLCRHHIIANSTFSWWGAWLCANPTKSVIAPKNWFRGAGLSANDLLPNSWIRI